MKLNCVNVFLKNYVTFHDCNSCSCSKTFMPTGKFKEKPTGNIQENHQKILKGISLYSKSHHF